MPPAAAQSRRKKRPMAENTFLPRRLEPWENTALFGHGGPQRFLQTQLASGRLHHALLLEGEEGIGKAGFAFHLAYHLLSEPAAGGLMPADALSAAEGGAIWRAPRAESALWRQMGQGAHPGLLYISRGFDPKTQKPRAAVGVEDIRRISRYLQQTAADKTWRIVIIDPADDMNRNAANALLKTLEEPPAKTLFLLISHNPGRLLPTIRSRCQSLRFKPLAEADMRAALAALAPALGLSLPADDAELLALAEGSPRRALTLLNQSGADIAHIFAAMLAEAVFPVPQALKLAETLAKNDNEEGYALFLEYILDYLYKQAAAAAKAGDLRRADTFAALYSQKAEAINEAAAFNLDKKQFILVLLQQLHSFLRLKA